MSPNAWSEPHWTVDQVRKLVERISSLVRTNRVTSTASTLLLTLLMLEFAILMYTFFGLIMGTPLLVLPQPLFSNIFLLTFLIAMAVYIVAGNVNGRLSRLLQVYRKIGLLVKTNCAQCNSVTERIWRTGDYVFKDLGECQCGGRRYVSHMYLMPLPLKKPLPTM